MGVSPRCRHIRCLILAMAGAYALFAVPSALARAAYVTNNGPGTDNVSVIDTQAVKAIGSPIKVGTDPRAIAISPDGKTAYVANADEGTVSVINTQINQVVGTPIKVGSDPRALAISPNGQFVYVVNDGSNSVSVIDTQTNQVVGPPLEVGTSPIAIAVNPNGQTAYVIDNGSSSVSLINTQTKQVVGLPIAVGIDPHEIAITPDGRFVYVTNTGSKSVTVINTKTEQVVGSPIMVGTNPWGIAISPDGQRAYVANFGSDNASVINTQTNEVVGIPITVGSSPISIAVNPDGQLAYVVNNGSESVSVINTKTNEVVGIPIKVGYSPEGIAIPPDQPPHAAFSVPIARPGVPVIFDASGSTYSGLITGYDWGFGDGTKEEDGGLTPSHTYSAPGTYQASLALNDDESCSTEFIFTGQTAYCNGSTLATQTVSVTVAYPGVSVKCPKSARPKGCKFKLQAVTRKPKKGKRKTKTQSAVAEAKLKAGQSTIVSLIPKSTFATTLATATNVLVRETLTTKGSKRTLFKELKIVQ